MIQLELTANEWRALLDMAYIAEWILRAHKTGEDLRAARYEALGQKLLARAVETGVPGIEYDARLQAYFPDLAFEDALQGYIHEYDNDTFWEELAFRLAERDQLRLLAERPSSLSREERFEQLMALADRYHTEFAQSGLENLSLTPPKPLPRHYH